MTMSENIAIRRPMTPPAGAEELVVSESVSPVDLRRLLESLIEEDCVHSWRNFGPDGTLEELLKWENEHRPTKLFFFYLKRGGTERLVAASAVADRLTRDFPHPGFPVLGRCCILPEYRSRGFYRPILQYRLEYCRAQYGNALNAIHIGAVNERISRVITNHGLPAWPRFIHLGEEELRVAGDIRTVGAYLLLLPEFIRRIQGTLAGAEAPPCVIKLRNTLATTESGEARNLGMLVKGTFDEAQRLGWFDTRDPSEVEQLLRFCTSVPLVGFR
jgi:GNAT superfamily N-acetyltransferase